MAQQIGYRFRIIEGFAKLFVLSTLIIKTEQCSWGTYGDCTSWSSCSPSCGKGTQKRTCYSCFWEIEKEERRDCNAGCNFGQPYNSNYECRCPLWRTGSCCQNCYHTYNIQHCNVSNKECGGNPDGIRCTQCNDPYYSAGYNKGCVDSCTWGEYDDCPAWTAAQQVVEEERRVGLVNPVSGKETKISRSHAIRSVTIETDIMADDVIVADGGCRTNFMTNCPALSTHAEVPPMVSAAFDVTTRFIAEAITVAVKISHTCVPIFIQ